jgi:N-acetylglucosaminyldiphosphoundecaprenol N-acetyl-beta-D-mannosaminyltransferase
MSHAFDTRRWEAAEVRVPRRRGSERRTATFAATLAMRSRLRIEERRLSGDRRRNPFQAWRTIRLGGLPVAAVSRRQSARVMVDEAVKRRQLWRYPA